MDGPEHPKKPILMVISALFADVHVVFGKDMEENIALFSYFLIMMATKTVSIDDAWIINSGYTQHVCNNVTRFVHMEKYYKPPHRSVNSTMTSWGWEW